MYSAFNNVRCLTALQKCITWFSLDEVIPEEKGKLIVVIVDICSVSIRGGVARAHGSVFIVVMLPSLICRERLVLPVSQVSLESLKWRSNATSDITCFSRIFSYALTLLSLKRCCDKSACVTSTTLIGSRKETGGWKCLLRGGQKITSDVGSVL